MMHLLTPKVEGDERTLQTGQYDDPGTQFTALSGTGFNPDSEQHRMFSDGLRYAIAIQQHRDAGDFASADAARDIVQRFGYDVGTAADRTVVQAKANMPGLKLRSRD